MDIVLTGLARSGTTLACRLLNTVPQVVALHEPMPFGSWMQTGGAEAVVDQLQGFYSQQRRSLLRNGTALSLASEEGTIPDNSFSDSMGSRDSRPVSVSLQTVTVHKHLDDDFQLVLKHPAAFAALLPQLVQRWPCFALVRNPLAVLLSWNSIDMKVQDGRIPLVEAFSPNLRLRLDAASGVLERQLIALGYLFEQIANYIPTARIIPYENLIATQGAALGVVTPAAYQIRESLEERNANVLYDRRRARTLARRLLEVEGAWSHFYSPEDVQHLLDRVETT